MFARDIVVDLFFEMVRGYVFLHKAIFSLDIVGFARALTVFLPAEVDRRFFVFGRAWEWQPGAVDAHEFIGSRVVVMVCGIDVSVGGVSLVDLEVVHGVILLLYKLAFVFLQDIYL